MNTTGQPDRMDRKNASPASLFKKVLQAFTDGALPYADVQSALDRLLAGGASPEELREVLRRCETFEPLPEYAHAEVLRILNEATERPVPQDAQPNQRSAERIAAMAEARTLPSDPAETAGSVEERIARQKADYKALTHAYERARDAGSAAAARINALVSDLAEVRSSLDAEQRKTRELDKALVESAAADDAARAYIEESRRELERDRTELRTARGLLAARDSAIDKLRGLLGERDGQLAALQSELASREAVLDVPEPPSAPFEADLHAEREHRATLETELHAEREHRATLETELGTEREHSTTLEAQLAELRAALESAQNKAREADQALADTLASHDGVRAQREEALRESGRYQAELSSMREALTAREAQFTALQREHAQMRPALESRAASLAAELGGVRSALEAEQRKNLVMTQAIDQKIAADETARARNEDALRKSEQYQRELGRVRELLNARQQEHTTAVAALQARVKALEGELLAARSADAAYERGAGQPAAQWQAAEPSWESEPAATEAPFDTQQTAPIASMTPPPVAPLAPLAPLSAEHGTDSPEYPLFGSRGRSTAGAVVRTVGIAAVLGALASIVWFFVHHAPPAPKAPGIVSDALPQPGTLIRDCPTCPALTVVPAGRFKQGSDHAEGVTASFEKPAHAVSIARPFAISTNAVTVDEFRAFIAATGRDMRGCETYDDRWRNRAETNWENPGFAQTGSHPVTCASWDDAQAYAKWLSLKTGHRYRLPSAAEWEYAARAGGEAVQPWSPDGSGACAHANVADQRAAHRYPGWKVFACDDGYVYTAPVGSFKANAFGLNDMLGNVFQWTEDCWHADYTGAPDDGSARTYGDCAERELRGGSWFTAPEFVRASYRNHFATGYRASSVGIRLVRDLAP